MHISNKETEKARVVLQELGMQQYDMALDLIKLYVSNGDVYNAIDIYEKLTPYHCSMFSLDLCQHGSNNQYERNATKLIRKELIKLGDYDLAWHYSEKESWGEDPNSALHAEHYFRFMVEVINHLCENNNKQDARKFVNRYIKWFIENVDVTDKTDDTYKNYNSQKSKSKLIQIINNY